MRIMIIVLLLCYDAFAATELETIRKNYQLAPEDKELCREMIVMLQNHDDPVYMAYLGAFQAIWAKHVFNPIEKLETFRKGKKNIESAIEASSPNVEIRALRLSIQVNAPKFLGYSSNIEEDIEFIEANRQSIRSKTLQALIEDLLDK